MYTRGLFDYTATYGITVQDAILNSNGVVSGKAWRCALFSARDVCRMFHHWKTMAPQPLQELAEGKVRGRKSVMIRLCGFN